MLVWKNNLLPVKFEWTYVLYLDLMIMYKRYILDE
jgi:hypothetical protein